jgi:hypothetical protein
MTPGFSKSEVLEVEVELTGTCNLDCPLCTRSYEHGQHVVGKNIRPVEDIIAQLDEFTSLKSMCIAGMVSEPTMYKDFDKFIQYVVGRNISVELYVNGNTRNPAWWRDLGGMLHPSDRVIFTVCGSTQELHEQYRVGSSLEQVLLHAAEYRKGGMGNDWVQHIRFEYNAADRETAAMQQIFNQFSNVLLIDSLPYQERFNIIPTQTPIKMAGRLGDKYRIIQKNALDRFHKRTPCKMQCKSFNSRSVFIDQYGGIHACVLYRLHSKKSFDHTDYSDILAFNNEFCYECESLTTNVLLLNGLEPMG